MNFARHTTPQISEAIQRNGSLRTAFKEIGEKYGKDGLKVVKVLMERALNDEEDYFVPTKQHPYLKATRESYVPCAAPSWVPEYIDEIVAMIIDTPTICRDLYRQLEVQFVVVYNNFKGGLTIRALLTAPGAEYAL